MLLTLPATVQAQFNYSTDNGTIPGKPAVWSLFVKTGRLVEFALAAGLLPASAQSPTTLSVGAKTEAIHLWSRNKSVAAPWDWSSVARAPPPPHSRSNGKRRATGAQPRAWTFRRAAERWPSGQTRRRKPYKFPSWTMDCSNIPRRLNCACLNASDGVTIPSPTIQAVILDNEIPPTSGPVAAEAFDHPLPFPSSLTAVSSDGALLELDVESSRLLRFAADGTLTSFSQPIDLALTAIPERALLAAADNKAILSAEFSQANGSAQLGIVRLLLDGTVDPTFMPPVELETNQFQVLATLRDGGILLAEENIGVLRLLDNGSRDSNFVLKAYGYVDTAVELESRAILIRMTTGDWY